MNTSSVRLSRTVASAGLSAPAAPRSLRPSPSGMSATTHRIWTHSRLDTRWASREGPPAAHRLWLLRVEPRLKRAGRAPAARTDAAGLNAGWDSIQHHYLFTHLFLRLHFSPLLQSRSLLHSTHTCFTQNSFLSQSGLVLQVRTHWFFRHTRPLLQFRSFLHSTHFRLSHSLFAGQSSLVVHLLADALSVSAESPTRPSAPPAAALNRPRRSDDEPTTRAMVSNRFASTSSSVSRYLSVGGRSPPRHDLRRTGGLFLLHRAR